MQDWSFAKLCRIHKRDPNISCDIHWEANGTAPYWQRDKAEDLQALQSLYVEASKGRLPVEESLLS